MTFKRGRFGGSPQVSCLYSSMLEHRSECSYSPFRSHRMIQQNNIVKLDAESILQLADAIIEKHRSEGCLSPLNPGLIAKLNYKLGQAKVYHDESEKYRALCQQAQIKRDEILGLDERQSDEETLIVDYLKVIMSVLEDIQHKGIQAAS